MTPVRTFAIIATPCGITGLAVSLADSPAALTIGLAIAALVTVCLSLTISSIFEWSRQDAVNVATSTLVAALNERNNEAATLRRRLESMKRRAG